VERDRENGHSDQGGQCEQPGNMVVAVARNAIGEHTAREGAEHPGEAEDQTQNGARLGLPDAVAPHHEGWQPLGQPVAQHRLNRDCDDQKSCCRGAPESLEALHDRWRSCVCHAFESAPCRLLEEYHHDEGQ